MKLSKTLIIAAVIILVCVGVAYAVYPMISNSVGVTVTAQETLALTVDKTAITQGEQITLTATCTNTTYVGTVTFTYNSTVITSIAAVAGVAQITWTPPTTGYYNITASGMHP